MFGDDAVNEKKNKLQGPWSVDKITWDVLLDVRRFVATLPAEKITKAIFILSDPELDLGLAGLKVLIVQCLRANMELWVVVAPSIKTELKAVDGILGLA